MKVSRAEADSAIARRGCTSRAAGQGGRTTASRVPANGAARPEWTAMHADIALRMMGDMFWTAFLVSAPILGITLLVGLTISVIQVVTQVQENALTFVPKLMAAGLALAMFGSWMLRQIVQFAAHLWASIPTLT
jgi:flagellar biosynthetic protein FliQ